MEMFSHPVSQQDEGLELSTKDVNRTKLYVRIRKDLRDFYQICAEET